MNDLTNQKFLLRLWQSCRTSTSAANRRRNLSNSKHFWARSTVLKNRCAIARSLIRCPPCSFGIVFALLQVKSEVEQLGEIPDEFKDPILDCLMKDPVLLPSGVCCLLFMFVGIPFHWQFLEFCDHVLFSSLSQLLLYAGDNGQSSDHAPSSERCDRSFQ